MQGMKPYTRLSQGEREQIFLWLHDGVSMREIGKRLGRSHTTISRELAGTASYSPVEANKKAVEERHKRDKHKLDDPLLQAFIMKKLGEQWSPEEIAGRLKYIHAQVTVSHETIYAMVYQKPLKQERLWEFLRRGHKRRERWFERRSKREKRTIIQGKIPISERPFEVKERLRVGHWETDLMEGSKKTRHVVSVTVERKSGAVMMDKLISKETEEKFDTLIRRLEHIPFHVRKTMTFDNGTENAGHRRLFSLRMDTYFCEPYHSWEKGTVENTIGLVREYLPKGMDLTHVTQRELMVIGSAINDRPRKRLGYRTPNEVLLQEAGWCVRS
jgi:transposase, IS30 family